MMALEIPETDDRRRLEQELFPFLENLALLKNTVADFFPNWETGQDYPGFERTHFCFQNIYGLFSQITPDLCRGILEKNINLINGIGRNLAGKQNDPNFAIYLDGQALMNENVFTSLSELCNSNSQNFESWKDGVIGALANIAGRMNQYIFPEF